jgi:type IV pilus assembly protein PilC
LYFKGKFNFIANQIEAGNNLSTAIICAEDLPEIWAIYARSAEKSSTYNKMFADLCDYYKTTLSNQINFLIKVSEPVLMVAIGLLVGILAYGILSPLYGIMNQLN